MSKPTRRPSLPQGALCAVLFSRGEKVYHWSFIYPTSAEDAIKFHAVSGAESWLYQRDEHFVARSKHACIVVQLNAPNTCTAEELDNVLKAVPLKSPPGTDETFTCRVWLQTAVKKLHDLKIIKCLDSKALVEELKELADVNNQASLGGLGFTLHKSRVCVGPE